MPLNIYLSSAESPKGANVISQLNPVSISFKDLIYGDTLPSQIFLVDGNGNYDPRSGSSLSVSTLIGTPGQTPIWQNNSWSAITNGWSGNIITTAPAFLALFLSTGMNPLTSTLEVKLTDTIGTVATIAQLKIKIYNDQTFTPITTDVLMTAIRGSYNLIQGADSGTVTGLGLSSLPTQVLPFPIRKPSGGINIFPNIVNGSLTTDGFSFTLDAAPDSALYWLDYLITFS